MLLLLHSAQVWPRGDIVCYYAPLCDIMRYYALLCAIMLVCGTSMRSPVLNVRYAATARIDPGLVGRHRRGPAVRLEESVLRHPGTAQPQNQTLKLES